MKIDAEILKEFIWIVIQIVVLSVVLSVLAEALGFDFRVSPIAAAFLVLTYYSFKGEKNDR